MKVGDIVRQGDGLVKFKGKKAPKRSFAIGTVVAIHEDTFPTEWDLNENVNLKRWASMLGRRIDVMWENGKLSEGFAERSLEVVHSG